MRGCGVLLHITSLPSNQGVGCFDDNAFRFVDWLQSAGCKYWQILGFNPTGYGDSPYAPRSVFAGNPYFIDLTPFFDEKELSTYHLTGSNIKVNYASLYINKNHALRDLYARGFNKSTLDKFKKENKYWLDGYAEFSASNDGVGDKDYYCYIQMLFFEQYAKLKQYANERGIKIIGDVPIYASMDGADMHSWCDQFDFSGVAGVPPDYFNADGQLWGNPLYDWKKMQSTKYKWWCERIKHTQKMFDILRIDHFRAFDSYWRVPTSATTAKEGEWLKGPGIKIFNAFKNSCPDADFILEDLGMITPSVEKLRDATGYPGMKVMQFGFDGEPDNQHLPHTYIQNTVGYLGTHDNDTFIGFLRDLHGDDKKVVYRYLDSKGLNVTDTTRLALEKILKSSANMVIISMQDLLMQGSDSRMNLPGSTMGNWQYRIRESDASDVLAKYLRMLVERTGRL
jgi:4-alpha-glucanotransferase